MNTRPYLNFLLLLSFVVAFPLVVYAQQDETSISFENDIRPILESTCLRCHGESEPEGGYRIDNRDEAMDYIEAGDAENSELYQYLVTDDEEELMPPPDEGGPLDDSDILLIKTWIDEGAKWPEGMTLQETVGTTDAPKPENEQNDDPNPTVIDNSPSIYRAIGSLHPATLHIPMGLLLAAGLFALLSLRGNFVMSDCAYYCLWLGTIGAIVACTTGWWFTLVEHPKEYVNTFEGLQDMDNKLFWHRTTALGATVFALLLALFAASARNRDPDDGVAWKLGLVVLAMGVGFVGHKGGELTWKASHYDELWEVIDQYIPGIAGDAQDDVVPILDLNKDGEPDPDDVSGETSDG